MMKRDYSEFQTELLKQIVEDHMLTFVDFSKFSYVCHSWNRASYACDMSKLRKKWAQHQMPWLMLTDGNDGEVADPRLFYKLMLIVLYPPSVVSDEDDSDESDSDTNTSTNNLGQQSTQGTLLEQNRKRYKYASNNAVVNMYVQWHRQQVQTTSLIKSSTTSSTSARQNGHGHETSTSNVRLDNGERSIQMNKGYSANHYYSSINPHFCQRILLNLSQNRSKCYNVNLPESYGRACWGSQYGWVVTLGLDREMHLYNPLTRSRLPLPSQRTFLDSWSLIEAHDKFIRNMFISKAVLLQVPRDYGHSCSTINEACLCDNAKGIWLVVIIYNLESSIALAKPGDKAWMPIPMPKSPCIDDDTEPYFTDVLFWPNIGSLIFISDEAKLFYCDIHEIEHPQRLKLFLSGPLNVLTPFYPMCFVPYIVECMGDILIIIKGYRSQIFETAGDHYLDYKTLFFRVHKLNMATKSWNEVQNLQDVALFLGSNASMCIAARDAGCRSNCIYFCDDIRRIHYRTRDKLGGHDMGIYNLDGGLIEPLYTGINSRSSYCCPFWFSPSI